MTREEIIDFCDMKSQLEPENEDIFNYIIKALEQEPCEDAISRQAVLNIVCQYLDGDELVDKISNLPSVTPKRKKGKWINSHDISFYNCSNCGVFWDKGTVNNCNMIYCPNCGAEMESEE